MASPSVGPETDDHRATCRFGTYRGSRCESPATRHVVVVHPDDPGSVAGLSACVEHYPVALAAGVVRGDHEHGLWCDLPGTVWLPETDECVPDESGAEPARRTAKEAAHVG
jgi:hypothetical protein